MYIYNYTTDSIENEAYFQLNNLLHLQVNQDRMVFHPHLKSNSSSMIHSDMFACGQNVCIRL